MYCGMIGVEYMYISDLEQKCWWQECLELICVMLLFLIDKKKYILNCLMVVEGFECYLYIKYVGQKCFLFEGGESFIVVMDEVVQYVGKSGVQEIIIGMVYCGCLNVLVNMLGKMLVDLFVEFEGKYVDDLLVGDVKYYKGFLLDVLMEGGLVYLLFVFNLLYFEIVNLVVEGFVKVWMDCCGDEDGL